MDRAKVLSVRLSYDEFELLSKQAVAIGVGPSTLARTLIRRGLTNHGIDFRHPTEPAVTYEDQAHPDLAARVGALEKWVADHSQKG